MLKRLIDLTFSSIGLILLLPVFLVIGLWIRFDSPGGIFYRQKRVGLHGSEFLLLKFRTMRPGSDKKGLLTVGGNDSRVTRIGRILRKYKLDELPQLINVLKGEMSLVGPRPEVKKYVDLYNERQRQVLSVPPGITDLASIAYSDENELLARAEDPERFYIETVMPAKLELNLEYIRKAGLLTDLKIIFQTLFRITGLLPRKGHGL